jgi:hypothetical protein
MKNHMKNKLLTLAVAGLALSGFVSSALASAWLYEKDVVVTARGPVAACDSPSSVDEFSALLKLKDYNALANYPNCEFMFEPPDRAITVDGFDIYMKLVTTVNGVPKSFWTRRGIFRSERDWAADDCQKEKKSENLLSDQCFELNDRGSWRSD